MTEPEHNLDLIAAEYVIGTLTAEERNHAESLLASEPSFAVLVRRWERRLGELHAMIQPVEPPPEIWDRLSAQLENINPSNEIRPDPTLRTMPKREDSRAGSLALWRASALGFGLISAVCAGLIVAIAINPENLPPQIKPEPKIVEKKIEIQIPAPAPARYIAVLQQDVPAPAFILTVDIENRGLIVRRVSAEPQPGKSYELWLISEKLTEPHSLGVVGADAFTSRPTLFGYDPATISSATYVVSLEPEGGSPNGKPSEILWTGKLIQSVPARLPE